MIANVLLAAALFYNIAPYSPGDEKALADEMREYVARTGYSKVLYCLSFHLEGRPAMAKTHRLMESYRALKRELDGSEVELGVLLQSTLGHWPRVDKDVEPWQRTVNLDGEEVRFCPADPRFQAFMRETVRLVAAESPSLVMTDDDVRAFSHRPECFCPLHTAEFNRLTGRCATPEEYRLAVAGGKDAEATRAFAAIQEGMVVGFARLVRRAIDEVDPSIPTAACMPGAEPFRAARTACALAGKGHVPILRLCNGQYSEFDPSACDLPRLVHWTQELYARNHDTVANLLDEADTFPHNLWSKSARSYHAKLSTSLFAGLVGAKLWYVNAHKRGLPVSRKYTDIMAEHRGWYDALVEVARESRAEGVRIPMEIGGEGWPRRIFGSYGVPFLVEADLSTDGIYALSGSAALDRLTDDDVRRILSHRVLLDGTAAERLSQRGFSSLIGVEAKRDASVKFTQESTPWGFDCGLSATDDVPILRPLPGARELTTLVFCTYNGAPAERVAPGATVFDNACGGRVVCGSWHDRVSGFKIYSESRRNWLWRLLEALDAEALPVTGDDDQPLLCQCRRAADGALLVEAVNLCYDSLEGLHLRLSRVPDAAQVMAPDGTWRPVAFTKTTRPGVWRLDVTLDMMQVAVVRLTLGKMGR